MNLRVHYGFLRSLMVHNTGSIQLAMHRIVYNSLGVTCDVSNEFDRNCSSWKIIEYVRGESNLLNFHWFFEFVARKIDWFRLSISDEVESFLI